MRVHLLMAYDLAEQESEPVTFRFDDDRVVLELDDGRELLFTRDEWDEMLAGELEDRRAA